MNDNDTTDSVEITELTDADRVANGVAWLDEDRVANGVTWLDENAPGWRAQVDVSYLDMSHPFQCVGAQVARGQGWYEHNGQDGPRTPYDALLYRGTGQEYVPYRLGMTTAEYDAAMEAGQERNRWSADHGFLVIGNQLWLEAIG